MRWRVVVAALVVVAHALAAVEALRILPQGFAVVHPKFVANTVLPWAGLVGCAPALVAAVRGATAWLARWLYALVFALAAAWVAAGLGSLVWFPVSLPRAWSAFVLVGVALGVFALRAIRRSAAFVPAVLLGALGGVAACYAQRAADPSTRPTAAEVEPLVARTDDSETRDDVRHAGPDLAAAAGVLQLRCGEGQIRIEPLLTFESRSPDRTWTLLAPRDHFGNQRALQRVRRERDSIYAWYTDVGASSLHVSEDASGVEVDARTRLASDVYAHLDAWTVLRWPAAQAGTEPGTPPGTQLSFSPTGDTFFEVLPADYPVGRPARMANLYADGTFRVVQASDGEKGPYHVLGQGALAREAPLVLRVRTGQGGECTVTFADWAAQVSTAPSPTAGWGVPQNSIQFFQARGEAHVFLTLADTGPGRGWDSVGHARGTYRNRVRVTNR